MKYGMTTKSNVGRFINECSHGVNLWRWSRRVRSFMCVLPSLALMLLAWGATKAAGVEIRMVGQPIRATVPVNSSTSTVVTIVFTVTTNGLTTLDPSGQNWLCDPVNLSATCPDNPAGLSFQFTDLNTNVITSFTPPPIPTTNASVTVTNLLWVNTTNVPTGTYGFRVEASGPGTGLLLLTVQSAYIWSGGGGLENTAWSDPVNWVGGYVPPSGTGAEVVFSDGGGLTNASTNIAVTISSDVNLGSLRHAITSADTRRHNFQLNPGVTLWITGPEGFSAGIRDRSDTSQQWQLAFLGTNASLVISNPVATIRTFSIENQASLLQLDQLGTLVAKVYSIHVSDYRAYPNWTNLQANGYADAALPRRMPCGDITFARTNVIVCGFEGDPEDWTNPAVRSYSFVLGRNASYGTTVRRNVQLGISNYFSLNSICLNGFGTALDQTAGKVQFHTNFTAEYGASNCIVVFRGTNGNDRVAMFAIADHATPGSSTSSTKGIVDLTGGTTDALVDKLWIARDRTNANNGYARGELYVGRGIFDCNELMLGYQGNGNNAGTGENYCQGVLGVSNGGLFRVNDVIHLGYTTADETNNNAAAANGYGQINVSAGATLIANEIRVGGVTKISRQNTISVTSGGKLIISNTVAGADKKLASLSLSDAAITVHIKGLDPIIYTTNLSATTPASSINVASIENIDSYPVTIPIIVYDSCSAANFAIGRLPSGLVGSIMNNTATKTIELTLTTNVPKILVWRGNLSSDWDTMTANWVTLEGGVQTNFTDGDFVVFDDTAVRKSVNIVMDVQPGQSAEIPGILVSNATGSYTFDGWSRIVGGTRLVKVGAGSLTFNAQYEGSVELAEGVMSGTGTVGTTIVQGGARLEFGGTIEGGAVIGGAAKLLAGGQINGPVTVQTGGSLTNLGTIGGTYTPSTMSMEEGSFLENSASGVIHVDLPWPVATNATLVNNGVILLTGTGTEALNIYGTLKGTGLITIGKEGAQAINEARVNINSGGRLLIGNTDGQIAGIVIATRLDFLPGSQIVFDVNPAGGNDVISNKTWYYGFFEIDGKVCFGQNASQGGTLYINRIGSAQFSPGQTLYLFDKTNNAPEFTIPGWPRVIPAPGPGLAWDISDMVSNLTLRVALPPVLERTLEGGTNLVFSWPTNYRGWRLEYQTNSLTVGLSTNWTTVGGSFLTNYVVVPVGQGYTNWPPNSTIFYRLAHP